MKKPKQPLSPTVLAELPQRLYNAAEAFYYAGSLCSLKFDAAKVDRGAFTDTTLAANAAISGNARVNSLGAPPIVNFGFSIELYLKLLRYMADKQTISCHNLHVLFTELEKVAPDVAATVIGNHFYSDDREEFITDISDVAKVFAQWRYAYEHEFLCASASSLLTMANAFRSTVRDLHPTLRSFFRVTSPAHGRTPQG